ncbi:MAG: hypothetical protein QOK36_230 [Gaiellales bacterium]|jgi:hypothetical protein|nr:hypothetical protein [Gaiellales bacterium]
MFANHEISDRSLLHRLLDRSVREDAMHDRETLAGAIDGAIRDAASASVPPRNRIARPIVVLSAASALSAVAGALRDEDVAVAPAALAAVRVFVTDGASSALYGRDPLVARRDAEALRRSIAGDGARRAAAAAVT